MSHSRRKPKRVWYMKKKRPIWIFKVHSKSNRDLYLQCGCVEISKEVYDSYPKKGKQ